MHPDQSNLEAPLLRHKVSSTPTGTTREHVLFLSTLLDALLAGVQWSFALSLVSHLLAGFLVYRNIAKRRASVFRKQVDTREREGSDVPACFLALNASSSSSKSFFSFLGAFKGLTLPPAVPWW